MKMSKRLILSLNIVAFILCTAPRDAHAWWSTLEAVADTHGDITKDVLDNKLEFDDTLHLDVDYPDLLMFKDELMNGSNTESHNIPDGLATEWWWPNDKQIQSWFYSGNKTDGLYGYGALFAYTNYVIHSAYMQIGRELHLVQDQFVPAHKRYCCHGESDYDWDGLEKKASLSHSYGEPIAEIDWIFNFDHSTGSLKNSYWLDDAMDDDDGDDEACWDDELLFYDDFFEEWVFIPDGPTHDDWGVANTAWGTYGLPSYYFIGQGIGAVLNEKLPGRDMGADYYFVDSNTSILYGQLTLAYFYTLERLKKRSRELPPLIPDDDKNGKPTTSLDIFGPNKPVYVSFVAMENRKPTVSVYVLAGAAGGIKDNISGKVLDGGANATMDLWPSDTFPWKRNIISNWNGDTATGQINDGIHEISMQIRDQDTHLSEKRTRSVMFDKTKPTGTITINGLSQSSNP